ncbi:transporter substrate-binding domain-containing protein [Stutzerimonas stutzeri]|uniref:Amino acid ABC transporter substrate-binding protein n=1 Tax=Stutzerimonas stutzeri TaxID=316 RepID=A0A2N8S0T7_STUST|nr:transporter substrate-binding domain-containing protein [Stutzerimonas stutzeri]PNF80240.1 amino acid ABC transporter substrate-binding protein [Stutzerimonas stutzeri]
MTPAALLAEPLSVQLPQHRVLSSSETESLEQALVERLAEGLGRPATVAVNKDADLRMVAGDQPGAAVYYRAAPAALSATEGGLGAWSDLQGQPVCVSDASPYGSLLRSRFAAEPREYPSAAHALIGLKLGECRAVVDDDVLLRDIATLPEWRRYKRLLPALTDAERQLRLAADDPSLQQQIDTLLAQWAGNGQLAELTRQWVDEVAFQAYVLADTLDCH